MRYLAFLLLGSILACQSPTQQEAPAVSRSPEEQRQYTQDSLFEAMMAVHDQVMPEMERIYRLRQSLKARLDSLQGTGGVESSRLDALEQAYLKLADADEAMMNWMRENDFTFEGMSHEEIVEFIKREKQDIEQVSEQMHTSIEEAEALLNE